MEFKIIDEPRTFILYGFSKPHDENKSYGKEFLELLDPLWTEVRAKGLAHKGVNHAVYVGDSVFAGIELVSPDESNTNLERKEFTLQRYAYLKHVGPYSQLPDAWSKIFSEIEQRGLTAGWPNLEIYGHWTEDETKLETEILIALK